MWDPVYIQSAFPLSIFMFFFFFLRDWRIFKRPLRRDSDPAQVRCSRCSDHRRQWYPRRSRCEENAVIILSSILDCCSPWFLDVSPEDKRRQSIGDEYPRHSVRMVAYGDSDPTAWTSFSWAEQRIQAEKEF